MFRLRIRLRIGGRPAAEIQHVDIGSRLIEHVDRLVRLISVVYVLCGEIDGAFHGPLVVHYLMVVLVAALYTVEDIYRLLSSGLIHLDFLKPSREGSVLVKVLLILIVGRRADTAYLPRGEHRLQNVRSVHRAPGDCPGPYNCMDLIDKEDDLRLLLQLRKHLLHPLLEVAPVLRTRQHSAEIEIYDPVAFDDVGDLILGHPGRQSLGDGGLSHPGLAYENGIVLHPPAEHLDRPLQDIHPADQGFELTLICGLCEIPGIELQGPFFSLLRCRFALLGLFLRRLLLTAVFFLFLRLFENAAVAYRYQQAVAGHTVTAEEVAPVRILLVEYGYENVSQIDDFFG